MESSKTLSWLAAGIVGLSASSCIPRPQPMTLVLTVPPQPAGQTGRASDPKIVYVSVPSTTPQNTPVPKAAPLPHTIQNFDLLEIVIGDGVAAPPTDELVRVQADGTVRLMNVGVVKVAGLDRAAAESTIADQVQSRQIMDHPVVRVTRKQSATAATAPHGPIVAGDVIHLVVRDLNGQGNPAVVDRRVNLAGMLNVPLLGEFKVAGMTDPQAAEAVAAAYAEKQILAKAMLDLTTLETAPPGVDPLDWSTELGPPR
jgi:protein involved in polysaccharide export with SLBB domain